MGTIVLQVVSLLLLAALTAATTTTAVRVCVAGHHAASACHKMAAQKSAGPLACYVTQDRYDCLLRLVTKDADVALAGPLDVFLANEILEGKLQVIGQTRTLQRRTENMRYGAVAVVRRSSISSLDDLSGAKSCHTGYRRTAGWHIPIAHLLEMKRIKLTCGSGLLSTEQDLMAISNFFGLACVPGAWAPDNETDATLKAKYPNLCSMCASPGECSSEDKHAGYWGALDCLTTANGDVAWTKQEAVESYFNASERVGLRPLYGLLCPDGSIRDLDQPCPWASRPWDAWLTRTGHENQEKISKSLKLAMEAATIGNQAVSTKVEEWATQVLGINQPSTVVAFSTPTTPYKYLSTAAYEVTIDRQICPDDPIRLCVDTDTANDKCMALAKVLKSRRVQPALSCVRATDGNCIMSMVKHESDMAALDAMDVLSGKKEYSFMPLLAEKYGLLDYPYYVVAVTKASGSLKSIYDLQGTKACFPAINSTAGWQVPVATLLQEGLLTKGNCEYIHEMGGLFDSACMPGVKSPRYDPYGVNPDSLCRLCVGNVVDGVDGPPYQMAGTEGHCNRDSSEAYFGFDGAFRCLVEGGGDVAFIKHTTVGENINSGTSNSSWAKGLAPQDFRLLCESGGSDDLVNFEKCYLARVPSRKVVPNPKISNRRKEEARILLLAAADLFPPGQNNFVLFGPYHGHNDIIFQDSATGLVNLLSNTPQIAWDNAYFQKLDEVQHCRPDSNLEQTYTSPPSSYNNAQYEGDDRYYSGASGVFATGLVILTVTAVVCLLQGW